MTPTHTAKQGVRYRYYVSAALVQGDAGRAGTVVRVPAIEIEASVVEAVRQRCGNPAVADERDLVATHVKRVDICSDRIAVTLYPEHDDERHEDVSPSGGNTIIIPWSRSPARKPREIIVPQDSGDRRPARAETRDKLLATIAKGGQ